MELALLPFVLPPVRLVNVPWLDPVVDEFDLDDVDTRVGVTVRTVETDPIEIILAEEERRFDELVAALPLPPTKLA